MAAFFNNTTQQAMDGNIKDTPPTIVVPTAEDRGAWEKLPGELAAAQQQIDSAVPRPAASLMPGWRTPRRRPSKRDWLAPAWRFTRRSARAPATCWPSRLADSHAR